LPFAARKNAVPQLLQCLTDAEPSVRALAAEMLAKVGDPGVVRHLFPLLADPDIGVAQAVTAAIQSLGSEEARALATAAARSESPVLRRAALRILGYLGGGRFEVFAAAIDDDDARVRDVAIQGLAFVDDPRAVDRLLQAARDVRQKVRASAARALGQCQADERILNALTERLTDSDPWVRYYACQSLGRAGHDESGREVALLLKDPAGQVRVAAVEALSHLSTDLAFGALRDAARSPEPDIQRAALIGLGIGGREEGLPLIIEALDGGESATRLVAVSALAGFADSEVIPAWERAARDADRAVSTAALANLSARKDERATRALIALLTSSRVESARVISALSVPVSGRVPAILSALRRADDELSPKLTSALARMRHPEANDALIQAFQSTNQACRKAAASALAAIGSPDGLTAVRRAADDDDDPQLKRICSLLLVK
jgi:HEAT repeat protein